MLEPTLCVATDTQGEEADTGGGRAGYTDSRLDCRFSGVIPNSTSARNVRAFPVVGGGSESGGGEQAGAAPEAQTKAGQALAELKNGHQGWWRHRRRQEAREQVRAHAHGGGKRKDRDGLPLMGASTLGFPKRRTQWQRQVFPGEAGSH